MVRVERAGQGVSQEGTLAQIVGSQNPTRTATQDAGRAEREIAPWSFGGGGTFLPVPLQSRGPGVGRMPGRNS